MPRILALCLFPVLSVLVVFASPAEARVLKIAIERRIPILSGAPFDSDGSASAGGIAYELIAGKVFFGFDPANPVNARVTDIRLAPVGESGLVEAHSDFVALQPINPAKRSGTALVDVPNRGRRLALGGFNRVQKGYDSPATLAPENPADWGDGFLMSQGLTILWVGWQADVPNFPGSMGLRVPRAIKADGKPVRGFARSDWVVDETTQTLALAALGHAAHLPTRRVHAPSSDTVQEEKADTLTRRRDREAKPETVPRSAWDFDTTGEAIVSPKGFEAGWIYELVYESEAPPLVGLGFSAFRDFVAWAEADPDCPFPIQRSIAHGLSQSGRFLRHFLYEGFNQDEAGRDVFDGFMIQIGGAGRGGFNHRFSHPGRVGNPYANFFYPGDQFPFTSRVTTDGENSEGLLDRNRMAGGTPPKIFQINTGYEYWGRGASLIHMTPDGREDVAPLDNERLYHIASAPHYSLPFPPNPNSEVAPGLFAGSSIDTSSFQRALLRHLISWVESDLPPPDSEIPTISAGTLRLPAELDYPIESLSRPRSPHVAYHIDYGPRWPEGIINHQPGHRGSPYAIRVPQVDRFGSEATGLRALELRAPIGTYTPWALRHGAPGGADEMTGYIGSFIPLARGLEDRLEGDARPSIDTIYPTREDYDRRVASAIDALVEAGWMLPRDRGRAWSRAAKRWDWTNHDATP
jgi:hypothetical protein